MCGSAAVTNVEQRLHFGHVTKIVPPHVRTGRHLKVWPRPTVDLPQTTVEDLAATRRTNLGLQDPANNR